MESLLPSGILQISGSIPSAAVGWILAAAGYVGTSDIMSAGVISAIKFIYGGETGTDKGEQAA